MARVTDLQTSFLQVFLQIDLVLSPTGPVIIPRGDILEFSTTIRNNRENIIGRDYWLSVLMPDSSEIVIPEILLNYANPLSGQILPSDTVELSNWLLIPTQAEPGSCRLIGRVGQFPNTIIDEESFGFCVVE